MNRAQYLTTDALPVAIRHLQKVGCPDVDAYTAALAAWDGLPPEDDLSAEDRMAFLALHTEACRLLGKELHAPDLRSPSEREPADRKALSDAYRWAGAAMLSHAEAFEASATSEQ